MSEELCIVGHEHRGRDGGGLRRVRRGKDAAKGDRIEPHTFLLSLKHGGEYFSLSLSPFLTEISAIQTRLALRVPSGVRSDDCELPRPRTENGLSHRDYILDRFAVGSDKTPGAYNDRDFGGRTERGRIVRNKKWCPCHARPSLGPDGDICRLVPIWIQI